HPAVLHLLKATIDGAHAQGIPVSICGEMAAQPRATPLLLGLGLDELSASPVILPGVKRVVRAIRRCDAEALAAEALRAGTAADVGRLVDAWLHDNALGVLQLLEQENGGHPVAAPDNANG